MHAEIGSEESGFSRRRVVKGVAWSVPVLVAAVGVPPASASTGSNTPVAASATLGEAQSLTITGAKSASGPKGFVIQTGTDYTGTSIRYTLTIALDKPQNRKCAVVPTSVSPGTGKPVVGTANSGKSTTYTDYVTLAPGNQAINLSLNGFSFSGDSSAGNVTFIVSLSVNVGASTVSSVSTPTLSVTF
ncbi:hypothetical protein [Pseudarthrobacter enclensis]|uniref:hypothetical protein n=1 Tax=Pseudarthrobacter enclensis TaxID=993070 RepID=UPI003EDF0002